MLSDRQSAVTEREHLIVDAFVHLADTLVDDYDVFDFLHYLTVKCVELVDADEGAIMLIDRSGRLQPVSSSSERSRLLELFELQNLDGPCLDAFRSCDVVSADDLGERTDQWPTFAPRALEVGFRSVHSVPLRLRHQTIGALNLMRRPVGRLSDIDSRLATALSDVATIGLLQERAIREAKVNSTGLELALTSRVRIEQAKGVIAERSTIDIDNAFDLLRQHARRNGLRLTDVADAVVRGELAL